MSRKRVLEIGAGMIGRCIVNDLVNDFDVSVLDMDEKNLLDIKRLYPTVKTILGSATDEELFNKLADGVDIVTAAMPGKIGYKITEIAMKAGKKLANVSSMHGRPDDPYSEIGNKTGGLGISMIGFEPGMSNFLCGRGYHKLDKCEEMYIFVGGIPHNPRPPFNYVTTWSISDNLNQFIQPSTVIKNGKAEIIPALSEVLSFEIGPYKNLECFTSNGLGSLYRNLADVSEMAAYTIRWSGLADQMRFLVSLGFFENDVKKLGPFSQAPRDILADILKEKYEKQTTDLDMSIMRILVKGISGGDRVKYTWETVHVEDPTSGFSSMAWTTASTCGIFARALIEGKIKGRGILSAEKLAADDDFYSWVISEQAKKGVFYKEKVEIEKNAKLWD
jgi:saccharopine dehydrogenase-like NADP-dependent oxidoreductase